MTNKPVDTNPDVVLSMKEKLAFSIGDFFGGGAQSLVATVYLVFLVVNGLSPAKAGTIIMLAKIWDAVTDPAMGVISDNTRSKWGRRKPYLFAGGITLIFSLAFLFLPLHAMESQTLKYLTYLAAYLIYNTISTMISVPFSSFATEMTSNYYEKNKMNVIRQVFSMLSGAVSAGIPIILLEKLNKHELPIQTFSLIMIVGFGLFYSIPLIIASVVCKERLPIPEEKLKFSIKTFLAPLNLKAFVYLMLMYLFAFSCMDLISTNLVWFVTYGIQVKSYSSFILLVIIMVSYAAMIPVFNSLMKKDKPKPFLYRVGIPLYIVGIIILCLYPAGFNDYLILPVCVIIGVGMAGSQLMPWFIFPDVVDLGEIKFNSRNTGSYSGLMTFIRKTTVAIAIGISGVILDAAHFIRPVTDYATGLVTSFNQPPSAVWGLRLVIMVPILIFMTIAFISSSKLKLNPRRSLLIQKIITDKSVIETMSDEDKAEFEAIKKELF